MRKRGEIVERSFAHVLERGGMRRTWLRGRENVHKRYLVHFAGYNLGILMRALFGASTPREATNVRFCVPVPHSRRRYDRLRDPRRVRRRDGCADRRRFDCNRLIKSRHFHRAAKRNHCLFRTFVIDFPSTSVGGRTVYFFVWHRAALLAGAAVGAFAGWCVTSVGIARAAEATDICLALAKNVKSDINIQGSIQQKFFQMQHLVGADIYASYSAAKDTKINADSDIAAYVDFVLETTSSDLSWAEN